MSKKQIYAIAEGVITGLVVIFIVVLLLSNRSAKADFEEIKQVFAKEPSVSELTLKSTNDVRKTFGINADLMEDVLYYSGKGGIMDVTVLLVVKGAKGPGNMEQIEAAVQDYIGVQMHNFDGYGTDQYDLLEHAVLLRKGDYYFCAVSEHAQEWEEVFRHCF